MLCCVTPAHGLGSNVLSYDLEPPGSDLVVEDPAQIVKGFCGPTAYFSSVSPAAFIIVSSI